MEQRVALVFTDLVDSTSLNARLGDQEMNALWAAHDSESRVLLRAWHGREIDRSDGFLAVFDDPVSAAQFAVRYHQMLEALARPIKARVGIHVGTVQLRHTAPADVAMGAKPLEVIGIAKAQCARVMGLALAGQTLMTHEAAEALAASALRFRSHGHWRLKGLEEPVELFELEHELSPGTPPPDTDKAYRVVRHQEQWIATRAIPRRLPAEIDRFFGRRSELLHVDRLFASGHRLVTVLGPGGMGKTRLTLRYAWGWLGEFPGGIYFCDLAQARNADDIVSIVARTLQLPPGVDGVRLGDAIAGIGRCLVLLDNFEQVVPCASLTLGRWLVGAPEARILVTSRERLGLPGEQVLTLDSLEAGAAVSLFHDRAVAASPVYRPAAGDAVMLPLVRMLDGLPLAIELAAARASIMTPERLLTLMGERFKLLTSRAGRPDRHATLTATLEWSWDLLTDAERSAMAQWSVFEGSFTASAAGAVIDGASDDSPWVFDLLRSLVDKSLLRVLREERYQFLSCIGEFAAGRLAAPDAFPGAGDGLAARARDRHMRYFAGRDEREAIAANCADVENLVAACGRACDAREPALAAAALRLSWAALRLVGPFTIAAELVARVDSLSGLMPEDRTTVRWVQGASLYAAGMTDDARQALVQGLASLHGQANPGLLARLHCSLGEVFSAQGNLAMASTHLTAAMPLAHGDGSVALRCQVLNAQGALAQEGGRPDEARHCYEEANAIAQLAGDRRWQAAVLGNLAVLDMSVGHYREALEANRLSLEHAEASGDLRWAGNAQCNLGLIHYELGELVPAEQHLSQALQIARRLGHRMLEFMALCNLGLVVERTGDLAKACRMHEAAVEGAQRLGDVRVESQLRCCLGSVLARLGRNVESRRCLERAHELQLMSPDPIAQGLVLCAIAENETLARQPEVAASALRQAAELMSISGVGEDSELARRYREVASLSPG